MSNYQTLKTLNESINKKTFIKRVVFTVLFFLKRYFSDFYWWVPFALAIVLLIGIAVIIPMQFAFAIIFQSILFVSTMIVYGIIYYSLKKSSLMKNFSLTATSKTTIYLSLFITIGIIQFFNIILTLSVYLILGMNGWIFQPEWFFNFVGENQTTTLPLYLSDVWWTVVFYYFVLIIIISFAISYFFQNLTFNSKTYYIICLSLLFYFLFFGGLISYRANIIVNSDNQIALNTKIGSNSIWFLVLKLLNPFYELNCFAFSSFIVATQSYQTFVIFNVHDLHPWAISNDLYWNLLKIIPYLWIAFLSLSGFIASYLKTKKDLN